MKEQPLPLGEIDPRRIVPKVEQVKAQYGIETHYNEWITDGPWLAIWMKPARQMVQEYCPSAEPDLGEMFAHGCRLIEEAGYCAMEKTEIDAVFAVCKQNKLPCIL